jgi:hypothetical protein
MKLEVIMLKKNWILLTTTLFSIITICVLIVWRYYTPSESGARSLGGSTSDSVSKNTQSITPPASASLGDTKITTGHSSASAQPISAGASFTEGRKTSTGVLGENLRKLLNSNTLTKIDYAESRIRPWCMVSAKQASEREVVLAQMAASIARDKQRSLSGAPRNLDGGGGASYEQRIAAMDRFHELCKISTENAPLTGVEYERIKLKPDFERRQDIAKVLSTTGMDINNVVIKDALETVVRSPLYATLGHVLRNNLDTAPLATAYTEDQMLVLGLYAAEILVCRLGDDCGPDGFANLQFCQMIGICGNDLESGIWDYLKENKVDTTALRQFIDQRQQALNLLDFSILKKSK